MHDIELIIRKFSVPCSFGGQISPFSVYIGAPKSDAHPVQHQDSWLSKSRGGNVVDKVKQSLAKLQKIAMENNVPLADLCLYSLSIVTDDGSKEQTDKS